MKNFSAFLLAGSLLLVIACGSPSTSPVVKKEDSASTSFLPVADYLLGEISYVDSTPLAIHKYTTLDNHEDSSFIEAAAFNQLAKEFLTPELAADSFARNFSENSFMDKTTGYLTFTYSARNKAQPLQRVDVFVAPGANADKVKSVYLEKTFPSGDTMVMKKMFWQTRRSFLVLTSHQLPGKAPLVDQLKVVWNE
jgi:hypothetical protein